VHLQLKLDIWSRLTWSRMVFGVGDFGRGRSEGANRGEWLEGYVGYFGFIQWCDKEVKECTSCQMKIGSVVWESIIPDMKWDDCHVQGK